MVYRGAASEWNYCSCFDFKTAQLGTCKHLEAVKLWIDGNRRAKVHKEIPPYTSVYLKYLPTEGMSLGPFWKFIQQRGVLSLLLIYIFLIKKPKKGLYFIYLSYLCTHIYTKNFLNCT